MEKRFNHTTRGGREVAIILPAMFAVCQRCKGHGHHGNPAFNGMDPNEMEEDFREAYFGGEYDVACRECGGGGMTVEVEEPALNPRQRKRYEALQRGWEEEARYQAMCAAERRMGA